MKFLALLISLCCWFYLSSSELLKNSEDEWKLRNPEYEWTVLEPMKLYDLLKMARTSEQYGLCKKLAENVFLKKHSMKVVTIRGTFFPNPEDTMNNDYVIIIQNLELLNQFFQTFGHLVQKIAIEFGHLELSERKASIELISKYSSDSLTELTLADFNKDLRSLFTNPLKGVKKLTIIGSNVGTPEYENLKLSELFPALNQLELPNVDSQDPSIFNEKFENLEHFALSLYTWGWHYPEETAKDMAKENIATFLQKNSQLKHLSFADCYSLDFVKIVHDQLPRIESFGIQFVSGINYVYSGEKMNFPTVKTLSIWWTGYDFSNAMSFDNVKELTLICLAPNCSKVALRNGKLSKLNLIAEAVYGEGDKTTYFDDNDILEIGEKQSNLKDLTINIPNQHSKPRAETIMKFVKQSNKLEHLRLDFVSKTMYNTLLRHFERGWDVTGGRQTYVDLIKEH